MRVNPKYRSQNSSSTEPVSAARDELRLLVAWPNSFRVFAGNVADHLCGRVVPGLVTTSAPEHGFWHGVDLRTPFPRRGLLDSVFAHAALLGLLYAVSIWPQSAVHLADPLSPRSLNGYKLSAYLPELHGAPTQPRSDGKHDPVLAQQEILSLPENPDNLRQTIITPPAFRIQRDIDLPNMVTYEPVPPIQPLAASERNSASLSLPQFRRDVIGPAADTSSLNSHSKLPGFEPRIVEPVPDVTQANSRLTLPAFKPRVVEPAPDLGYVNRGQGSRGATASFANLLPHVDEPVPETPQIADEQRSSGQMIALSLHPAEPHRPLELPQGNRKGVFAASPIGHPEAAGTPGKYAFPNTGTRGSKAPVNAPAGISVAAVAPALRIALPNAPAAQAGPDPDSSQKFMAATHPPVMSIPPHQPIAKEATGPRSELENRIFAGRRSYTLSINMPNLNAATGSWLIHFVERRPGSTPSPIAAPEVVRKSDPAYPGGLMHDGVQGTVILTAIIRADGSVSDIVVAQSLDPNLDQNAAQALSRWLFRPALKNGHAIDLEAVITVPFRTKRF